MYGALAFRFEKDLHELPRERTMGVSARYTAATGFLARG